MKTKVAQPSLGLFDTPSSKVVPASMPVAPADAPAKAPRAPRAPRAKKAAVEAPPPATPPAPEVPQETTQSPPRGAGESEPAAEAQPAPGAPQEPASSAVEPAAETAAEKERPAGRPETSDAPTEVEILATLDANVARWDAPMRAQPAAAFDTSKMTPEVMDFLLWLMLLHVHGGGGAVLNLELVTDAIRHAVGVEAGALSTATRLCPVEVVAIAQFVIEHAPEALRPAMRVWLAPHEAELDRRQSGVDRPWRTVAATTTAWMRGPRNS